MKGYMHALTTYIMGLVIVFLTVGSASAQGIADLDALAKELPAGIPTTKMVPLAKVLNKLEADRHISFVYESGLMEGKQVPQEALHSPGLAAKLGGLLKEHGLAYHKQARGTYVIRRLVPEASNSVGAEQISGTVTDAQTGETLPGVNILVKGTSTGASTDADGQYEFTVESLQDTLVVSFVGYETQQIPINGRTEINVALQKQAISGEEMVVVGFGEQKEKNLTESVSTIDSDLIENRPVTNVANALQGVSPGLNITRTAGGELGTNPDINIRGIGTIGEGSSGKPLVLIDGMEGNINTVNPQDIESISVLKDISATSIYGSRAAFGVIRITTKKGTNKFNANYQGNFRWHSPITLPNPVDSYRFATFINDAGYNSGEGAKFNDKQIQRIKDYQAGRIDNTNIPNPDNPQYWAYDFDPNANVNWYDAVYKNISPSMEHSLSFSNGTENMKYYLSGDYVNEKGLMELSSDTYKRYNISAKITADINEWASFDYYARWGSNKVDEPSYLNKAFDFYANQGRRGWPTWPLYDPNGYMWQLGKYDYPVGLKRGGRNVEQRERMSHQFQLTLDLTSDLEIFGAFNYKNENFVDKWTRKTLWNHDVNEDPYVAVKQSGVHHNSSNSKYINTHVYGNYDKSINGHEFNLKLGLQSETNTINDRGASRQGLIIPDKPYMDLTSGYSYSGDPVTPQVNGGAREWATLGTFGRLNYNFKSRYLAEVNLRYDGTSRFRGNKRWNLFPSASIGWNMAAEPFWENLNTEINTLKFRVSYGSLGNQNTTNWYPTFQTMPIRVSDSQWLVGGKQLNTASIPSLVSPSLTWEKVSEYNAGVDFSAFQSRLTANFDYYTRFTKDMVGPPPTLPSVLGREVPKINNTELKTYGFEAELSWNDNLNDKFAYNIRLTFSDSKTKILEYPNPTGSLNKFRTGQMMGEIWGYETKGIAKTQEEMDEHLASLPNGGQNALGSDWNAGDIMYKDINGDGKIDNGSNTEDDPGDLVKIGNSSPRYRFGLNIGGSWKGFSLNTFVQGVMKRDFFVDSHYFWGVGGSVWSSMAFEQHMDYFRNDPEHPQGKNLDSYYPRPMLGGASKNQQVQTRYLQNAAYLRVKNITLGYTLPQEFMSKIAINNIKLYVSGENLFTATNLIGQFDPETVSYDAGSQGQGGGNVYPLSKIYSIGLNIKF